MTQRLLQPLSASSGPAESASPRSRAAEAIAECRLIATMSEEPGCTTRRFLSPAVADVHSHLRQRMTALGMTVRVDAAGNLRGLWQPPQPTGRRILIGSHIDTVPNAGAFDGVLGVVLALHLVEHARNTSLPLAIEVIAFSEEEGVRFNTAYLGSRAAAGRFDPALLNLRDADGITLEQAIRDFGLNPSLIDEAQVGPETVAYLELHIEQGPILEAEDLSLAAVTAITGQTRCEITFTGHANHAGTSPMHLRQDALAAAAEWISHVESTASQAVSQGAGSLVATVGKILVEPNTANVIAGKASVTLDLRSPRDEIRLHTLAALLDRAEAIALRRKLKYSVRLQLDQPAVPMDERLTGLLESSIVEAGFPARTMSSGAGHDALILATRVPAAMLFLRSPGGISHHPDESARDEDIEAALRAATIFLRRISHDNSF